jgi:hypothetical protein
VAVACSWAEAKREKKKKERRKEHVWRDDQLITLRPRNLAEALPRSIIIHKTPRAGIERKTEYVKSPSEYLVGSIARNSQSVDVERKKNEKKKKKEQKFALYVVE